MSRKLIRLGPSTLVVSLPKAWCVRNGLSEKDQVDLEERGQRLLLTPPSRPLQEELAFDMSTIPAGLVHEMLVAIYKAGLGNVQLVGITREKERIVKETVSRVAGFEITHTGKTTLRIQDLGVAQEEHLKSAEQQIYWKLLRMCEELPETGLEELQEVDDEVNRLAFFIQRKIRALPSWGNRPFLYYEKIELLEKFGDALKLYRRTAAKMDRGFLKDIGEILDTLRSLETKRDARRLYAVKRRIKEGEGSFRPDTKGAYAQRHLYKLLLHLHHSLLTQDIRELALPEGALA